MASNIANNPAKFELQREGAGRYEVYLTEPRMRLGHLFGKAGHWHAEDPAGRIISAYNTRGDGAEALLNQARVDKRF